VSGGYNLFGLPPGGIFNYTGPYYFQPPFAIGPPGGLYRVPQAPGSHGTSTQGGLVVSGASGGLGGLVTVPRPGSHANGGGRASSTTGIFATPASSSRPGVPDLLWALIPLGLIAVALVGMVVLEPDESVVSTQGGPGTETATRTRPKPPPGMLVLLGFGVRRVARTVGDVAGGLFGGSRPGTSSS
jgi:hypothetical protein